MQLLERQFEDLVGSGAAKLDAYDKLVIRHIMRTERASTDPLDQMSWTKFALEVKGGHRSIFQKFADFLSS